MSLFLICHRIWQTLEVVLTTQTDVFTMKTSSKTFQKMRNLREANETEKLNQVIAVTAMIESVSEEDVLSAFDAAVIASEARDAVDEFQNSFVKGYSVPSSLSDLVANGQQLAERFGGTVQFVLDSDDDGNVSVSPRFRGIEGVTSSRGGASGVRYAYSHNGEEIQGKVEEFILSSFPDSKTAGIFRQYREARAAGKTSRIGAIAAIERGTAAGDRLGITWEQKTSE